MSIYEKLNKIQCALVAPKDQKAGNGSKVLYKYRSCEDILEALKPHLAATKTILTLSDEVVLIGDRFYIKATATIHDLEASASISNTAFAREPEKQNGMGESQITGSASSYARKYALNGLFAIDDSKQDPVLDPDTDAYRESVNFPSNEPKAPAGRNTPPPQQNRPQAQTAGSRGADSTIVETCDGCGAKVPAATVKWCRDNAEKYGGRILCYECQHKK